MAHSQFVQNVLEKSDIVKVVSSFLPLQRKGQNYVAICPFHKDTNPSLSVSPSRNIFKCFVCGTAGSAVSFVMKYEDISFKEAVIKVAQICNIPIPSGAEKFAQGPSLSPAQKALDDLEDFYQFSLKSSLGVEAMKYLQSRQIDSQTIEHFGIGYAPRDSSLSIRSLKERKGHSLEDLIEAGIISAGSTSFRDRYSQRVMFPIKDASGHTVGFSGRKFLKDDPSDSKYINSPETKYFVKSEILYNYHNARAIAQRKGYIYVVEGFMDCIALYRAGEESCVALMGTALTKQHMALLKKLGCSIRMCLDSDNAGQENTAKWVPVLSQNGFDVGIVEPFDSQDGKDADEVLDKLGASALIEKLNRVQNPLMYVLSSMDPKAPDTVRRCDRLIKDQIQAYDRLSDLEKMKIDKKISELTGIGLTEIKDSFNEVRRERNSGGKKVYSGVIQDSQTRFKTVSELNNRLNQAIASYFKASISNSSFDKKLIFDELGILCRIPMSLDAVRQYASAAMDGNGASLGFVRDLMDYVLEMYDNGQIEEDGLSDEQLAQIQDKMLAKLDESDGDEDLSYTEKEVTSAFSVLHLADKSLYQPKEMKRSLLNHQIDLIKNDRKKAIHDHLKDKNLREIVNGYQKQMDELQKKIEQLDRQEETE